MDIKRRIYLSLIIERAEKNKAFAQKLGITNKSQFKYGDVYQKRE